MSHYGQFGLVCETMLILKGKRVKEKFPLFTINLCPFANI